MKRLKLIAIGLMGAVAIVLSPTAQGATGPGIMNSPHNFIYNDGTSFQQGTTNWYPNGDLCEVCHTVHKAPYSSTAVGPLWNHTLSANTSYTAFTSVNMAALGYAQPSTQTPGYSSMACLSCHDGSIAINQFGGGAGKVSGAALFAPSWAMITSNATTHANNDLSGVHPIGISLDTAASAAPLEFNAATVTITAADSGDDSGRLTGTIAKNLLFQEATGSDMIECASCHDIHQIRGCSSTAKDSLVIGVNSVSDLCMTCHIK